MLSGSVSRGFGRVTRGRMVLIRGPYAKKGEIWGAYNWGVVELFFTIGCLVAYGVIAMLVGVWAMRSDYFDSFDSVPACVERLALLGREFAPEAEVFDHCRSGDSSVANPIGAGVECKCGLGSRFDRFKLDLRPFGILHLSFAGHFSDSPRPGCSFSAGHFYYRTHFREMQGFLCFRYIIALFILACLGAGVLLWAVRGCG